MRCRFRGEACVCPTMLCLFSLRNLIPGHAPRLLKQHQAGRHVSNHLVSPCVPPVALDKSFYSLLLSRQSSTRSIYLGFALNSSTGPKKSFAYEPLLLITLSRLPPTPFPPRIQTGRSWLEGRQLRSNFGTTKYCATYLRNSPCSNPDCLYLHELGDEEDRFTKEEIQQRSLLAPPIPPGAVTVTGGGGPSGTGMRCNSPYLPPPVYQTSDNGSGAREGGSMGRSLSQGQHGAGGGATAAQRAVTRGAKPTGQVCDVLWHACASVV